MLHFAVTVQSWGKGVCCSSVRHSANGLPHAPARSRTALARAIRVASPAVAARPAADLARRSPAGAGCARPGCCRRPAVDQHELEQLVVVAEQPLGQRLTRMPAYLRVLPPERGDARNQPVVERLPLRRTASPDRLVQAAAWPVGRPRPPAPPTGARRTSCPGCTFERVQVAQQMHPAALMRPRQRVVAGVEVADQVAHDSPCRSAAFATLPARLRSYSIVAHRLRSRRTETSRHSRSARLRASRSRRHAGSGWPAPVL